MRRLFMAVATTVLCGCAGGSSLENLRQTSIDATASLAKVSVPFYNRMDRDEFIRFSHEKLTSSFKDPSSAQFRNVRIADFSGGKVVCGEVNGKNSYGAYVGFKPYVAGATPGLIWREDRKYPDIEMAANAGIVAACG